VEWRVGDNPSTLVDVCSNAWSNQFFNEFSSRIKLGNPAKNILRLLSGIADRNR
jgi:hypothetical protein